MCSHQIGCMRGLIFVSFSERTILREKAAITDEWTTHSQTKIWILVRFRSELAKYFEQGFQYGTITTPVSLQTIPVLHQNYTSTHPIPQRWQVWTNRSWNPLYWAPIMATLSMWDGFWLFNWLKIQFSRRQKYLKLNWSWGFCKLMRSQFRKWFRKGCALN